MNSTELNNFYIIAKIRNQTMIAIDENMYKK